LLKLDEVHTCYGSTNVLCGVSLEVKPGTVVGILGRNGMGKTTTVHSIVGFVRPSRGHIFFKDREITQKPTYDICRSGIGLVPQGRLIFSSLTVYENLMINAQPEKGTWNLDRIYGLFPRLKERYRHSGTALSGGEQQMLAIARTLLTNPEVVLMDEPSEGLAPMFVHQVCEIITEIKREGLSVLLVEQNMNMALKVSDYIYILDKGRVACECSPEQLANDKEMQSTYLGVSGS
jgi:branched-chain amino acid transport system ATP-binding protein